MSKMDTDLSALLNYVKSHSGLQSKKDISTLSAIMPTLPEQSYPNGDDTAVIHQGDSYQLLAMEGFIPAFVEADPWFAGWCSVMVNLSDIAAMGGRPTALVNAIWSDGETRACAMMEGIRDACHTFGVPMVGGHSNLRADHNLLSAAVLGHARSLLSSFNARPGQILVAAIDLRGSYRKPFLNWNAATDAPAQRLREDLELLPRIAEQGLASAAKDISQAGLLGTAIMLLESSEVGAEIDLNSIPKPKDIGWQDWLCTFPSFGYLLTTDHEHLPFLLHEFEQRNIAAAAIGRVFNQPILNVRYGQQYELFWNMETQPLMGLGSKSDLKMNKAIPEQTPSYASSPIN